VSRGAKDDYARYKDQTSSETGRGKGGGKGGRGGGGGEGGAGGGGGMQGEDGPAAGDYVLAPRHTLMFPGVMSADSCTDSLPGKRIGMGRRAEMGVDQSQTLSNTENCPSPWGAAGQIRIVESVCTPSESIGGASFVTGKAMTNDDSDYDSSSSSSSSHGETRVDCVTRHTPRPNGGEGTEKGGRGEEGGRGGGNGSVANGSGGIRGDWVARHTPLLYAGNAGHAGEKGDARGGGKGKGKGGSAPSNVEELGKWKRLITPPFHHRWVAMCVILCDMTPLCENQECLRCVCHIL